MTLVAPHCLPHRGHLNGGEGWFDAQICCFDSSEWQGAAFHSCCWWFLFIPGKDKCVMPVSYFVPLQCVVKKASGKTFTITLGFVPVPVCRSNGISSDVTGSCWWLYRQRVDQCELRLLASCHEHGCKSLVHTIDSYQCVGATAEGTLVSMKREDCISEKNQSCYHYLIPRIACLQLTCIHQPWLCEVHIDLILVVCLHLQHQTVVFPSSHICFTILINTPWRTSMWSSWTQLEPWQRRKRWHTYFWGSMCGSERTKVERTIAQTETWLSFGRPHFHFRWSACPRHLPHR